MIIQFKDHPSSQQCSGMLLKLLCLFSYVFVHHKILYEAAISHYKVPKKCHFICAIGYIDVLQACISIKFINLQCAVSNSSFLLGLLQPAHREMLPLRIAMVCAT